MKIAFTFVLLPLLTRAAWEFDLKASEDKLSVSLDGLQVKTSTASLHWFSRTTDSPHNCMISVHQIAIVTFSALSINDSDWLLKCGNALSQNF